MKARPWLAIAALSSAIAFAQAPTQPQPQKPRETPAPAAAPAAQAAPAAPVYKPPAHGAPQRRVGGASRSGGENVPYITVIAPDHVALTLSEQPELYWFISGPSRVRIELALVEEADSATIKEVALDGVATAGMHRFSLAEHGVRLARDVDYQWSVALVPDPDARSGDVVSAAAVRRVAPDPALAARLSVSPAARATALAEAGIWYDAVALSCGPGELTAASREHCAALLEQVGLEEAARFERR